MITFKNRPVKFVVYLALVIIVIAAILYYFLSSPKTEDFSELPTDLPEENNNPQTDVFATNLNIPWEIVFLSETEMLVTERPGSIAHLNAEGETINNYDISEVANIGEGGLLGMVLHPQFEENKQIYLYMTMENEQGITNKVARYKFNNDGFTNEKIIIDGIPGAVYHDGGRIEFGPEGYLFITTGDAGTEELAQDTSSLAGKILRLTDEGEVPDDNPFDNEVWSYGHRNPQGIAWDDKGQLWATEHGRSGLLSGFDEINLIEKGKNYGWPEIQGDETAEGMVKPVIHSGPDVTWAPAGLVYIDGTLFFTGLRGESVYQAEIQPDNSINSVKANFTDEFGRLRAIKLGDDGYLYISTSNRDGRGQPLIEDDRIIKTNPELWM